MDWKETDQRLIRRGELILDTESLKKHGKELKKMNEGRPGPKFKLANSYVELLAAVRYLYQMPYRQLEGFTRTLHRLVPDLPQGDYSGLMIRILSLPVDPYRGLKETSDPVSIAVDSTGIKAQKAGGWIERKHGKKKRYVKLHFAVNTETHEVVAMEISTDDVHDVKALPGLVEGVEGNVRVARVYGDWAYDSGSCTSFWGIEGFSPSSSPGGTPGWIRGLQLGGGLCLRSGSWGTRLGPGSPAMGGGGLWRPLTRRLSGCLGSLASPGALRASSGSWG